MRNRRRRMLLGMMALVTALVIAAIILPAASVFEPLHEPVEAPAQSASGPSESAAPAIVPKYDGDGALVLPPDWRRWVFVGSSLGLAYEGRDFGMEMFQETLMEPTAYTHFAKTGTFREGTMFVLVLHGVGENVLPARRGRFAAELHGVEMAVKDTAHRPEGWAYYNFGGMMGGLRKTAQALPKTACYSCHVQHAKRDNVFLQFYPLLEDVAPRPFAAVRPPHGTTRPSEHP